MDLIIINKFIIVMNYSFILVNIEFAQKPSNISRPGLKRRAKGVTALDLIFLGGSLA